MFIASIFSVIAFNYYAQVKLVFLLMCALSEAKGMVIKMKVVVLGGAGLQGRAVLYDLSKSQDVKEIVCVDADFKGEDSFQQHLDMSKISKKRVDVTNKDSLAELFKENVDVVIDVLPKQFNAIAADAAVEAGVNIVNCSYASALSEDIYEKAENAGVTVLPEAGLDPGIDLVLCGYAVSQLDEVYDLYSFTGGMPEKSIASANPLKYKVTWNFYNTLLSYYRPAKIMKDGKVIEIPAADQNREKWKLDLSLSGIDGLEAFPNGDAVRFAQLLGIEETVRNTERRAIRWAGHMEFWSNMVDLGFFEEKTVPGLPAAITPTEFLAAHLGPRLQYKDDEKDLVLMKNIIRGKKDGKNVEYIYELAMERNLEIGLYAMNMSVGYTASIAAQMIVNKVITKTGVLNPITDIPYQTFIKELSDRGIQIIESKRFI